MIIETYTDDVKMILRELVGVIIITQTIQPLASLRIRATNIKKDTYSIHEMLEFYGKTLTKKNERLANEIMYDNEDSLYESLLASSVRFEYENLYRVIVENRKQKPKFENLILPLLQEFNFSQMSLLAPEKEFILFCIAKLTYSDNIQLEDESKILQFIAKAFAIDEEIYEEIINFAEKEERPTYHFLKKTVSGAIGSVFDKLTNKK